MARRTVEDLLYVLFQAYWANCRYPIVLNTETKDYRVNGVDVRCAKVAEGENHRADLIETFSGTQPQILFCGR
jgi:hypothetical protein